MSSSDSNDSFDEIPTLAEMMVRRPSYRRPSYADKVRGTPPVADVTSVITKFQEPSGREKTPVELQKITSLAQKEVAPVAVVSSKKKPSEKKKPATHPADNTKKNPCEVDWFSHPSHPPPHKKEKKIREKLGLPNLEMALSQAEMALSQASLTSASTTFSFLQAAVTRAKEEIEKRDATIKLLETETSAGILSKYAPPPLDEKRVYLGKKSPSSIFKTKHLRLHYLNILPQHLRSKIEEDEISELMIFFNDEKEAGNVEGEPCGLSKMWIIPKKKNSTFVHTIKDQKNEFAEFHDIKCKGESPSLEEGKTALMRGRRPKVSGRYVEDFTYFDDDEYLINVSKDVCEHEFGVPLNSNAAMWITSGSGVCIYSYKNEENGSLMLFTTGTSNQVKRYANCQTPGRIVQMEVGKHKRAAVHRVMMMAISPIFDPEQWALWEVDHIGRGTTHNDILNLRWVLPLTNKQNFIGKNWMNKKKKSIG
jgi:hypothetical protein